MRCPGATVVRGDACGLPFGNQSFRLGMCPGGGYASARRGLSENRGERAVRLGLLLVLAIGLALRAWSVAYGLPDLYHPDEPRIVERAVRFHQGGPESPVLQLAQSVHVRDGRRVRAGVRRHHGRRRGRVRREPALFYLVGRLVTAVLGTATLAESCTRPGASRTGGPSGILAAALLAVDLLPRARLALGHDRRAADLSSRRSRRSTLSATGATAIAPTRGAAGLVAGLATSMKYPGGLAFLGLLVAHVLRRPAGPASAPRR